MDKEIFYSLTQNFNWFGYAIDATKIEKELGWRADENFGSGIMVDWYLGK